MNVRLNLNAMEQVSGGASSNCPHVIPNDYVGGKMNINYDLTYYKYICPLCGEMIYVLGNDKTGEKRIVSKEEYDNPTWEW